MNRQIAVDFGTSNTIAAIRFQNGTVTNIPSQGILPSLAVKRAPRDFAFCPEDDISRYPDTLLVHSKIPLLEAHETRTSLRWVNSPFGTLTSAYLPESETNESLHQPAEWRVERQVQFGERPFGQGALDDAEGATVAILAELKNRIEREVGQGTPLDRGDTIIFAVPAQTHHYRQALMALAVRAGWPVSGENFRAFPEPYAILLKTLGTEPEVGQYLVVDIGGGTTDWALVEAKVNNQGEHYFILRDSLRQSLGGSDVDHALAKRFFDSSYRPLGPTEMRFLEMAKISLSRQGLGAESPITLGGKRLTITWDDVAESVCAVFQDAVLQRGYERFHRSEVRRFILAGGASQSPGLFDLMAEKFGRQVTVSPSTHIASACAQGLLVALDGQALSGVEDSLGFMEYPSQERRPWIEAFDSLPEHSTVHTRHFRFNQGCGRIPLFLGQGEDWRPVGYLEVFSPVASISPVWRAARLEFIAADGVTIPWIHQDLPYLRVNAVVSFAENSVRNQSSRGLGVISELNHGKHIEWVGSTDDLTVVVRPDGDALVRVKAPTRRWALLDLGDRSVIRPSDLPRLEARPLPDWSLSPFEEIDDQVMATLLGEAANDRATKVSQGLLTAQPVAEADATTGEGCGQANDPPIDKRTTHRAQSLRLGPPLKFPMMQRIYQLEQSDTNLRRLLRRYAEL